VTGAGKKASSCALNASSVPWMSLHDLTGHFL
jgi:hypothetical protein